MIRRALLLLLALGAAAAGAAEIRLADSPPALPLTPLVSVFEDKSAGMDIDEVAGLNRFVPNSELQRPGFTPSAIWVKIDLANDSAQPIVRWLEVQPSHLSEVTLFLRDGERWQRMEAGIGRPFSQRAVAAATDVFPIELPAGERATAYLRLAGPQPINIAPVLWDPLEFRSNESRVRLVDGLLLGGLVVVALIGALLLALFRDRVFLFNALATATYFFGEFSAKGYALMHLWPEHPELATRALPLFAILGVGLNLLFLRDLLATRHNFPRIDKLLLALLASEWVLLPGVLFGTSGIWAKLSFPQHFPITVVMALVGVYAAAKGVHAARYYTAAYLLLALGSLAHGLEIAGIATIAGIVGYGLPIGMLLNNLFLMASAVDHVVAERRAREAAQNALLDARAAHEAELERAVDNRTADLNAALVETRKASQAQTLLLAYIGHDLRAPLATIIHCSHRLARHADPAVRHDQTTIERSAAHQLDLIDDLVEYARGELDHLELTPEPTFVHDWLDNIAGQAELLAAQRGNRFVLNMDKELPAVAVFDAKRLRQVVLNLLGNAAKFTNDGEVRLCLAFAPLPENKIEIEFAIEDTGAGIPADDIERIFQPFERRQSKREGSGLGLTIARHLVRAMGGELKAASTPNVGSRFEFRLALEIADETDVARLPQAFAFPEPFGRGKALLIADDNVASREYLREVLSIADFDIACASDGAEAMEMAAARRFDAIIVDQVMPGLSGWDVLRKLHEARPGSAPPVVLCSSMRPQRPADFPAGIDFKATLLKPVSPDKLLQVAHDMIGRATASAGTPADAPAPPLAVPPAAELAPLRTLIDGGNISEIEQWSAALAAAQPEYAAFAAAVESAAVQIDFATLNSLAGESARSHDAAPPRLALHSQSATRA